MSLNTTRSWRVGAICRKIFYSVPVSERIPDFGVSILVTVFAEVLSKMAAMWRRKEDHVSGNFLCRYVQNYLLLPVIFIETRKIQLFLSSESIRGKESDLVEPDNSLLSGFLRQWHDLAARALKILLKIVWPLAPQSVKRLIDHLKWEKIYMSTVHSISLSLFISRLPQLKRLS